MAALFGRVARRCRSIDVRRQLAMSAATSTPPNVVFVDSPGPAAAAREFVQSLPDDALVTLDCEGVRLPATLCLVQVAVADRVFLFDTNPHAHLPVILQNLRAILRGPHTKAK